MLFYAGSRKTALILAMHECSQLASINTQHCCGDLQKDMSIELSSRLVANWRHGLKISIRLSAYFV